jgi:hypothetical protein
MNPERDESLTADNFNPGKRVSVDHFESRLLGRTFALYGKTSSDQYKGGCIFLPRIWISSRVAPSGIFSNRDNTGKAELRENGT